MGAGVQTTALLIKFWRRYVGSYVIFADTGDEHKETYEYIEKYLKPFCLDHGVRWKTVKIKSGESLMEYSMRRKITPIKARRWCTADFKIKPIQMFIRSCGAVNYNPAISDIGISMDESHRVNYNQPYNPKYIKVCYPLIDAKMTRDDCKDVIKMHGWPLPRKSGCDFCPFAKKKEFVELYKTQPERFAQIRKMEEQSTAYPKRTLTGRFALRDIANQSSLGRTSDSSLDEEAEGVDNSFDGQCDSGHCFV